MTAGSSAPFVLARPDRCVTLRSPVGAIGSLADARSALAAGAPGVAGAVPFAGDAAALWLGTIETVDSPADPAADVPAFAVAADDPLAHRARVAAAVATLGLPGASLQKVVLAREITCVADRPAEPGALLARLAAGNAAGNAQLVDLSPAGGGTLVGASPELLLRREGDVVVCHPYAGSAPREQDEAADRAAGAALAASAKNLAEHRFVVEAVIDALRPLCVDLTVPSDPSLAATPQVWHLGTRIVGRLREPAATALDLLEALHPTPAVCGTPTDEAARHIAAAEPDRRFYAGAVGWQDARGDGEWVVAIRCAELSPDRRTLTAWAGGGIVAASDPDDEVAETTAKLGTVLASLGVARTPR